MIAGVSEIEIESRMSFKRGAFIIRIKLFGIGLPGVIVGGRGNTVTISAGK